MNLLTRTFSKQTSRIVHPSLAGMREVGVQISIDALKKEAGGPTRYEVAFANRFRRGKRLPNRAGFDRTEIPANRRKSDEQSAVLLGEAVLRYRFRYRITARLLLISREPAPRGAGGSPWPVATWPDS